MCHHPAKFLFVVFLVLQGVYATAQTSTVSNPWTGHENNPYTKYGIGELQNGNNTVLKGMGNITSAYENPFQVNTDNPASYSFLTRTTFEAGATAGIRTIDGTVDGVGTSYKTGTSTLSYLNIAFPTGKTSGICLGFRPYSHVYYALTDTIQAPGVGETIRSYAGEGGLNYAFIGGAKRIKGLSLGFNIGYLFGTISNTSRTTPVDSLATNNGYRAEYTNYTRIGGIQWKGGAMYETKLDSFRFIRIGGTITISQNVTERLNAFQISSFPFGDTTVHDTVYNSGEQRGNLKLPLSYSFGAMIGRKDKWSAGLDYTATNWSSYNSAPNTALNTGLASNAFKISLGGDYTPDINNITAYFSRVTYRAGIYYGTDYIKLENTTLPYYGFTLGASLPFRRTTSRLHLALDAGTLGTTSNGLMKENYIKFSLGLSFNDLWFARRKLE